MCDTVHTRGRPFDRNLATTGEKGQRGNANKVDHDRSGKVLHCPCFCRRSGGVAGRKPAGARENPRTQDARAEDQQVSEFKLANGLQLIVIPDHRAPVVTHMIYYKVGSADESPGKSGIAHFLEHLMFKGTAKSPWDGCVLGRRRGVDGVEVHDPTPTPALAELEDVPA